MAKIVTKFSIFIASPNDLEEESSAAAIKKITIKTSQDYGL
jgi:hypothetical protein